ncbi:MAG: hypothetical protein ACI31R_04435 [Bacilli bacterium]
MKKNNNNRNMKKIYVCMALFILVLTIVIILKTYGLFESKTSLNVQSDVGKWVILINDTDITSGANTKFSVNEVVWNPSDNVKSGKLAPGVSGYFDIVIDPTDTDVSVRYDIDFDFSEFENTNIVVSSVEEVNNKAIVKTGQNKYTGVIPLNEIKDGVTNTIRVNIKWDNNEENNEYDSEIGSTANAMKNIPVTVNVSQYLGETIE